MPTIRVDDDVYAWLQAQAKPFEDTPNSVLRRVAGLETGNVGHAASASGHEIPEREYGKNRSDSRSPAWRLRERKHHESVRTERLTGDLLRKRWKVPVRHALYHQGGTFYENLQQFPGALFDPTGYVVFETFEEYRKSPYLRIGRKLNVPQGISAIPGYVRKA